MIKIAAQGKENKIVLVGVLKNKRDLDILLHQNWYRIPAAHLPTRPFKYLAFYQPAIFGSQGKRIKYYARVLNKKVVKRIKLLSQEPHHPRAQDYYCRLTVGPIQELAQPIRNIIPRRIIFGFIDLSHLLKSKDILHLYGVAPIEQMVENGLKQVGIKTAPQYPLAINKKRFRLDFAVFCQNGKIAIECDNKKAHASRAQKQKDKIKNAALRQAGWTVIRLPEAKIISDLPGCLARVTKAIHRLKGAVS